MQIFRNLLLLLWIPLVGFSCLRKQEYPLEPVITYDGHMYLDTLDQLGNTVRLCRVDLGFTDGDGDIGLRETDITGPFHPDSTYHNNLWVGYYEFIDQQWVEKVLIPSYSARIPYLTPRGQNKALKGVITYDINITNVAVDTFKFDFVLVDRSLQHSNKVESPMLFKN
jgi:hypothetical protein